MGSIYVMALGDADPQKKAKYIEDMIKKGYDDIFFIDDSAKNVAAVQQLEKKYPDVKFRIQLAKL
jgi:basic membrane lipoprotein Med (substrate-binding protein (PBP1-ABC) superfamily)